MAKEKNLFGMLDEISETQTEILNEVTGVKTHVSNTDEKITALEQEVSKLKNKTNAPADPIRIVRPKSDREIFQDFIKQSKKSWRWFGTRKEFNKWKTLATMSMWILLLVGLVASIVSTICFQIYSTFTLFENIWMIFGIIYLVYDSKTRFIYEVNELASNSPRKYMTDKTGMKFPEGERGPFRVFKWLAIISVLCNIICIWANLGNTNKAFATIMEVLLLGAIISAHFMNANLYAQYAIIWIEGRNLETNKKVVLVLLPGSREFITKEEFIEKMGPYFE